MKRLLMTVPGILTDINDPLAWFRQFASRFELLPDCSGLPYAYFAAVVGAPVSLTPMADEVAELLRRGMGRYNAITVAAHSHGNAIILEALKTHPAVKVQRLVLIAAAVDVDCWKNGLNQIAERGQVGEVVICYSPNDTVLAGPGTFPGYGQLGLWGAVDVSAALAGLLTYEKFAGGHGCYFDDENVERTWQIVTPAAAPASDDSTRTAPGEVEAK